MGRLFDKIYNFGEEDAEQIVVKHGDDVRNLVKEAFSFIQRKSDLVKGNFEFTIFNDDGTKILIVAGERHYKFLATFDSEGKTKIRRFAGMGELKAGLKQNDQTNVKEVNEDTLLEILQKMWNKYPEIKYAKSATGLLCMRIAYFMQTMKPEYITNVTPAADIEIAFYDSKNNLHIFTVGEGTKKVLATFDSRGNPVIWQFSGHEYSLRNNDFIYHCNEINKRSLGQMIIDVCGNEGSTGDENTAQLRGLFQTAITYLEKEKEKVWKNAELTVYDNNYDAWKIRAGHGHNKFVGNLDGNGEMVIINSN